MRHIDRKGWMFLAAIVIWKIGIGTAMVMVG